MLVLNQGGFLTACGSQNFVLGLRRLVRKLFSCCWISVTSVIVQEIPGSPEFFRRTSNFKIAGVINICHRAPVFLRPTFISCNTYCYVFSNGRILQEQVSSRPRLSFRHESCGAGYFACPPVARTSCSLCGRRTLSAGIYIASLLWIDSTVFSVAAMRS